MSSSEDGTSKPKKSQAGLSRISRKTSSSKNSEDTSKQPAHSTQVLPVLKYSGQNSRLSASSASQSAGDSLQTAVSPWLVCVGALSYLKGTNLLTSLSLSPLHFAPHQSIFWSGSIVDMGIWRAGGVVVMGRRWGRFTLCHLTACLAPHISVEMPVMAKQPYKAGFGFYSWEPCVIYLRPSCRAWVLLTRRKRAKQTEVSSVIERDSLKVLISLGLLFPTHLCLEEPFLETPSLRRQAGETMTRLHPFPAFWSLGDLHNISPVKVPPSKEPSVFCNSHSTPEKEPRWF